MSQAPNVLYRDHANADIQNRIAGVLTSIGSPLSVTHILDRASTQTCAGCHQQTGGTDLGGGLTWPNSAGFVHIDEGGFLSEALTDQFLPHRKGVLEDFINAHCVADGPAAIPAEAGRTIGGGAIGAAN